MRTRWIRLTDGIGKNRAKLILWIGGAIAFVALFLIADALEIDSGLLAAVASVLATFAALGAAIESRSSAQDASKALSLATKPQPRLRVWLAQPDADTVDLMIGMENLGVHPIAACTLDWYLADGTRGALDGGRFEAPNRFEPDRRTKLEHRVSLTDPYAGSMHEVALSYRGELGLMWWKHTVRWHYAFDENVMTGQVYRGQIMRAAIMRDLKVTDLPA